MKNVRKSSCPSEAMSIADINRQIFVRNGYYKGMVVAIKTINKSRVDITRSLLLELKRQTKKPPQFAKVDLCGSWRCNLGQSLSNYGAHVFYRRKIRRANRPGKQFNLVVNEEPLEKACHLWSRIILLKYGCGQALKVRKDNWLQHLRDVALAV
ncbi:uncharacterized protein TNCV_3438751 [Trichonephila clavipes]|nr:uncharacterized protein TNCV_3438751 [Trichonephila clavipes]